MRNGSADRHRPAQEEHRHTDGACSGSCPFHPWRLCSACLRSRLTAGDGADRLHVGKGRVIAEEGYFFDGWLVMLTGIVKLFKSLADGRRQIVGFRYPGELVTSRSCVTKWHISVEAITPATLCRISCDEIRRARQAHPELDYALVQLARRELTAAQDHMLTLGQKSPSERLASFLLEIDRKSKGERGGAGEIHLPMTRVDIGDYLGLENETVSRLFSGLREKRVLDLPQPWTVRLLDRQALIDLAEGTSAGK